MSDLVKNPEDRFSQNEAHMYFTKNECMVYLCLANVLFGLFGLRLYIPVNNFSVVLGCFSGLNQYSAEKWR